MRVPAFRDIPSLGKLTRVIFDLNNFFFDLNNKNQELLRKMPSVPLFYEKTALHH